MSSYLMCNETHVPGMSPLLETHEAHVVLHDGVTFTDACHGHNPTAKPSSLREYKRDWTLLWSVQAKSPGR
jgi:hypothetical protein